MPLQEDEQPQDTFVPPLVDTEPAEDEPPLPVCNGTAEAVSDTPEEEPARDDDVRFCFVCGQKLLPDALFCSRCGKKVSLIQPAEAPAEPPQPVRTPPREDTAKPVHEDFHTAKETKQPHDRYPPGRHFAAD
jgi:hypothetical protein